MAQYRYNPRKTAAIQLLASAALLGVLSAGCGLSGGGNSPNANLAMADIDCLSQGDLARDAWGLVFQVDANRAENLLAPVYNRLFSEYGWDSQRSGWPNGRVSISRKDNHQPVASIAVNAADGTAVIKVVGQPMTARVEASTEPAPPVDQTKLRQLMTASQNFFYAFHKALSLGGAGALLPPTLKLGPGPDETTNLQVLVRRQYQQTIIGGQDNLADYVNTFARDNGFTVQGSQLSGYELVGNSGDLARIHVLPLQGTGLTKTQSFEIILVTIAGHDVLEAGSQPQPRQIPAQEPQPVDVGQVFAVLAEGIGAVPSAGTELAACSVLPNNGMLTPTPELTSPGVAPPPAPIHGSGGPNPPPPSGTDVDCYDWSTVTVVEHMNACCRDHDDWWDFDEAGLTYCSGNTPQPLPPAPTVDCRVWSSLPNDDFVRNQCCHELGNTISDPVALAYCNPGGSTVPPVNPVTPPQVTIRPEWADWGNVGEEIRLIVESSDGYPQVGLGFFDTFSTPRLQQQGSSWVVSSDEPGIVEVCASVGEVVECIAVTFFGEDDA